jgi:hypothetical protein
MSPPTVTTLTECCSSNSAFARAAAAALELKPEYPFLVIYKSS